MTTTRRDGLGIDDIKAMLRDRLPELVRTGWPGAVLRGRKWEAVNHMRGERNGGSFFIYADGPKMGGWVDYGGGLKGDVLQLAGYALEGDYQDPKRCWAAALRFLGLDGKRPVDPALLEEGRRRAAARQAEAERRELERLAKARGRAFKDWLAARPIEGTLAEAYLAGRGIDCRALAQPPRALRFADAAEWWRGATRGPDGRKAAPGPSFPALVAFMSGADGKLAAVQYTFLDPAGGKAKVDKPKLIYPDSRGSVIRLAKGVNRCTPEEAVRNGLTGEVLVLVEGIEDGLTIALACPEARVWAVCGVSNLRYVPVPASVTSIVVAADNDWGKAEAARALEQGLAALRDQVPDVRVARSAVGKDFNDWLRAEP